MLYTRDDLHKYQVFGVNHMINNDKAGLFLDMGLGKTITTLTALVDLFELFEINKVLIIGTKRIVENVWAEQAVEWEHTAHLKFSKIVGTPKQRLKALEADAQIYLISRDNVAWLCGLYGGRYLPFDTLVIDELSSFKNPKSVRFKALRYVLDCFYRRYGLTGTPSPNGLPDLWGQLYLIDKGERLGTTLTGFRDTFFKPDKRRGAVVYNYKLKDSASEEAIQNRIKDICISMKAEDYLTLPEKVVTTQTIHFDKALSDKYEKFKEEMILEILTDEILSGTISAANIVALYTKLLQFANGAIYSEDRNYHELHNLKLLALEEVVEEANGAPVLVATAYQHDTLRIHKHFKQLKPKALKHAKDIDDWNAGKIQMLTMHPASGGHGLNMQKGGNILVWFGLTWNLEFYQQLNARLYRQGQTKPVFIHHLAVKNTMDDVIMDSLADKHQTQERIMNAVKALIDYYRK